MITALLPLTSFRLRLLAHIHEQGGSHIRELSSSLGLHLYSVQKAVEKLRPLLTISKIGSTKLLELDRQHEGYRTLIAIIEDYRSDTAPKEARSILRNLAAHLPGDDQNLLAACLFGSHARGKATGKSDIDILVVVRKKDPALARRLGQLGALFGREVSPLVLTEEEFLEGVEKGEPALLSLREPGQRYIIRGADYFLSHLPPAAGR